MSSGIEYFYQSELALAAYAELSVGDVKTALLIEAGMSNTQAERFVAFYPKILSHQPDTENGFSATVFRDKNNQLVVALRGTAGISDLIQDVGLTIYGCAYAQIVDMANWWAIECNDIGQTIYQYDLQWSAVAPANAILKMQGIREGAGLHSPSEYQWLVRKEMVTDKRGALYGLDDLSSVNVTGHSLGGHLASAFTSIFSHQVDRAFTYNGPGFKDSTENREFFAALQGVASADASTPFTVKEKVTRVQANNALAGEAQIEAISNLHGGTPGTLVQVAIEDKGFWKGDLGTANHSIVNVTDSLALYGLLTKLEPSLDMEVFNEIFHGASSGMESTRERLLDSLYLMITGDDRPLPVGEDHREAFYQRLYSLQENSLFTTPPSGMRVMSSWGMKGSQASTDFSAFVTLYLGAPVYLQGVNLNLPVHAALYQEWNLLKQDQQSLDALADALALRWHDFVRNKPEPHILQGVLSGTPVDDILEGSSVDERFFGGSGVDTYRFDWSGENGSTGRDTLYDRSGANLLLDGITLGVLRPISADSNIYSDDANPDIRFIVSGSTLRVVRANTRDVITLEGFHKDTNSFGLVLGNYQPPSAAAAGSSFIVGDGLLGEWDNDDNDSRTNTKIYFDRTRGLTRDNLAYDGSSDYLQRVRELNQSKYPDLSRPIGFNAALYRPAGSGLRYLFDGSLGNDVLSGKDQALVGGYDELYGLDGDDVLTGDSTSPANSTTGNDADILVGGRGNDQLYGGGGSDKLYGYEYIDPLTGVKASLGLEVTKYPDLLEALYRGEIVSIENIHDRDYLDGGSGSDTLLGGGFDDKLYGGTGVDFIFSGAGQDQSSGGTDNDQIWGDSTQIYRAMKNGAYEYFSDFVAPDARQAEGDYRRAHFYIEQAGEQQLRYESDLHRRGYTSKQEQSNYNDLFADDLDGGAGNDAIYGEIGNDLISGGDGNDTLMGDRTFNAGWWAGTADSVYQSLSARYHGDDVIDGGSGNDRLVGGGGNDLLFGGHELPNGVPKWSTSTNVNDVIYGDLGINVYDYATSADEQSVTAADAIWWGNDYLSGGNGNDLLVGEGGDDVLDGGNHDDLLYGDWKPGQHSSANSLHEGLYGGDDVIDGGSGDDYLYGGAGNDTLRGGSGSDYLSGDAGNDTYIVYAGHGADRLSDTRGKNILQLMGTWLNREGKLEVSQVNKDVFLLTAKDPAQFVQMTSADYETLRGRIYDADGNRLELHASGKVGAGQTLSFEALSDVQYELTTSGNKNAFLRLLNPQDQINFSTSEPLTVNFEGAQAGFDLESSSGGVTSIIVSSWSAFGGIMDSNRQYAGFKLDYSHNEQDGITIDGRAGNDVIIGGNGNEVLAGESGSDSYIICHGNGQDIIYDQAYGNSLVFDSIERDERGVACMEFDAGNNDIVLYTSKDKNNYVRMDVATWNSFQGRIRDRAGEPVVPEIHIILTKDSTSPISLWMLDGVSYRIDNKANPNCTIQMRGVSFDSSGFFPVELDGNSAALTLRSPYYVEGCTVTIENFDGFIGMTDAYGQKAGFEIDYGTESYDGKILTGRDGFDRIVGGSYGEEIYGNTDANTPESNWLEGNGGNDRIYGGDADDYLSGGDGDDVLFGGAGIDQLDGGQGSDTYTFSVMDGKDTITRSDESDQIRLDVSPNDIYITRDGNDWWIRYFNTKESFIHIVGTEGVRTIHFQNHGIRWDLDPQVHTSPDEIRTISAAASASSGRDDGFILFHLDHLLKNDSNLLERGYQLVDVRVVEGIEDPAQFYYGDFWGSPVLGFRPQAAGYATLQYFVRHQDGGPLYAQNINVSFDDLADQVLNGSDRSEILDSQDALAAIVDGGRGDDWIIGGAGADTILHRVGDGNDTLTLYENEGWQDQLLLIGNGSLKPADLTFEQDTYALKVHLGGEAITVEDYFHDTAVWGEVWTRYGEVGHIRFFIDEAAYQAWLADPASHPPAGEWTPETLKQDEMTLRPDWRELWGYGAEEGLLATAEGGAEAYPMALMPVEAPEPGGEGGSALVPGPVATEAEPLIFFDNSMTYP